MWTTTISSGMTNLSRMKSCPLSSLFDDGNNVVEILEPLEQPKLVGNAETIKVISYRIVSSGMSKDNKCGYTTRYIPAAAPFRSSETVYLGLSCLTV